MGCGEAIGLLQLTAQQTPLQLGAALGLNTRRHQPALRVGGLQLGQLIWISGQQPQQTANSPVVGLPALIAQQFPNRLEQFGRLGRQAFPEPLTLAGLTGEAGGTVKVAALGLGDADAVEAAATIRGEALIPPTPVHLRAERADGGLAVRWVRRSRAGWRWTSGSDVPLAEESERYTVRVLDGDRLVRGTEVAEPGWTYDAATIAADGTAGTIVTIEVAQVGTRAAGRAARLTAAL